MRLAARPLGEWLAAAPERQGRSARAFESPHASLGLVQCEVVVGLQVQPELWSCAECLCEQPCGVGSDTALAPDDLVDVLHRDADVLAKGNLGDLETG